MLRYLNILTFLHYKVGFPIRTSTVQSLFAAPRSFSQRTTSFIACVRQGIHQTPFWHLITLIINIIFISTLMYISYFFINLIN